jgi:hypothetical protein
MVDRLVTLDAVRSDRAARGEVAVEPDEREGGEEPAERLEALAGEPDGGAEDLGTLVEGGSEVESPRVRGPEAP